MAARGRDRRVTGTSTVRAPPKGAFAEQRWTQGGAIGDGANLFSRGRCEQADWATFFSRSSGFVDQILLQCPMGKPVKASPKADVAAVSWETAVAVDTDEGPAPR